MTDFIRMRQTMIHCQLLPEGVTTPSLLQAFQEIPREKFVPRQLARIAYMDENFPLNKNRYLLKPAILGRLLEALNPQEGEKILYVGAATGYGPAVLSQMGTQITALDSDLTLTQQAEQIVQDLKLPSLKVVLGPLEEGWENDMPYDKILIEGHVDFIPSTLFSQLKEGGTLVSLFSSKYHGTEALKLTKYGSKVSEIYLFGAFAPRLTAFSKKQTFVF